MFLTKRTYHIFAVSPEDSGDLRSGGVVLGGKRGIGGAIHHARSGGPLHGGDGISCHIGSILIVQNIGIGVTTHIHTLVPGIPPQGSDKLFAGYEIIGSKATIVSEELPEDRAAGIRRLLRGAVCIGPVYPQIRAGS